MLEKHDGEGHQPTMFNMALPVMDFQDQGYKIRKTLKTLIFASY